MSISTQITVAATAETIIITAPGALRGPMGDVTPEAQILVERAETAAAQSQSSAGQAASSAAQAGDSASQAGNSASSAAQSAAAASDSETAAGLSASSAQSSASSATSSEAAASSSASAAQASAGEAQVSASAADQSATEAAQSATSAQEDADATADRVARFLAPSAVEPTQRDNGQPLQVGDQWPKTTDGKVYSWTGSAWVALDSGAQQLEERLSEENIPTEGAGIVGFSRDIVYPPSSAGVALMGADVTPWEFADLLTYTPGADPAGWDWSPVINGALRARGEVSLGFGAYGVRSPIVVMPGNRIKGKGPGHAGGTAYSNIFASRIIALADFSGDAVFTSSVTSPENVLTAPQLEQFRLDLLQCGSHGIHFLDVYDGVKFDNLHVVGAPLDKYACWLQDGSYGLGQTLMMTNSQFFRRPNSTSTMAVSRFEAVNESSLIGCKWFGSSGGVLASAGAAVEFAGCSGMTLVGCSTAFSADGVAIVDHPRKTIGFSLISHTFEAHTRTGFVCKPAAARKATEVHLVAPRYYDSVFNMINAIDVDNVEISDFDCQFKRGIVGSGADQNIVHAQRQTYITDSGTNTLILSRPNAIDAYYGINKRIRAISGLTSAGILISEGGLCERVALFTAQSGKIGANVKTVLVNRATQGNYELPSASAFGSGFSMEIVIRGIGAGSIVIAPEGLNLIEGLTSLNIPTGGKARLISDGASNWYVI